MSLYRSLLAGLAALLLAPAAFAHPHVMIDAHAVVQFEHGKAVALLMGWKFDPVFSSTLVHDFDTDKDGKLSPAEIAKLEKEAFQDTSKNSYFTFAKVDGKLVTWPRATDFKLLVIKDSLLYSFRLPLPAPVDPRQQSLSISTYEETYYIDIDIVDKSAVAVTGDGSSGCKMSLSEDRATPLFGGIVFPKKADMECE